MLVYLTLIDSEDETSKFEIIYERYKDLMFYVADRILNDAEDAEDAVHQSFLKIIGVLEKIEDPLCPKTRSLIVIITERTAIDLNRKLRRTLLPMDGEPYGVSSGAGIEDIPIRMDVASAIAALPAVLAWARWTYGSKVLYRFTDETPETLPRYSPAWLPEGFVLADDFQSDISRSLYYVNDETGEEFVFDYSYMYDGPQIELYNPNGIPDPEKLTVNGMEADFYPADDFSAGNELIWFDEAQNVVFVVNGTMKKAVILHIAESVDLEDSTKN